MKRWLQRRTTVIMVGLMSILVGLVLGRKIIVPFLYVFVSGIILLVTSRIIRMRTLIACAVFGLALGCWRGSTFFQQIKSYEKLYGQEITIQAQAKVDGVYADNGQLEFDVDKVQFISPLQSKLPGTLRIQAKGLPAVYRGDIFQINGKLYPTGGSRQGSIKYANVQTMGRSSSLVDKVRLKFVSGMQTALPEPHASFGLGLLIGQRSTLPEDLVKQLSIVGLTHIIAVSGYNLTIIIRSIGRLFGNRSKYQTTILSFLLIGTFLLFTGFSASIVRAAIISVLSIGAWYFGRTLKPLLILLLAAALTAGWYPVYLWSDVGWYLSFLAFFGVLIIAPLITKLLWTKRQPWGIMPIIIESGCAQLMAAPLIMYIFKETSLIALPSNMLIVPMIPIAMLLVLVAGLAGMLLSHIAGWLSLPAQILLSYILSTVALLSRVPHALIQWSISLPIMIISYVLICLACYVVWMKTRPKYGMLTDTKLE